MARRCCRLRRVLICVCTPCCSLIFLYIYAVVTITMNINNLTGKTVKEANENPFFVAPGASSNGNAAPAPETFWKQYLPNDGLWNQLQQSIDHLFNPILHPNKAWKASERSNYDHFLLKQTFIEVTNMEEMRNVFEKLPREIQAFISSMQKRDYPVLIHPKTVCGAQAKHEMDSPLILLAIKSTELNFKNRQAIRHTWGQAGWVDGQKLNSSDEEPGGGYVRRVFLLGKEKAEDLGLDMSAVLRAENEQYGDILQWDFKDTFFNLTLKDVLFWSWFSHNCGQIRFVFKGDDDVFVNTPRLVAFLRRQLNKTQVNDIMEDFMVGDVIAPAMPNRVKKSKYFIPDSFYTGPYPAYAGGGGVVYSGQLARRLNSISRTVHLFPIDDVYVGMCMFRLNANPLHHSAFITFDLSEKEEEEPCSYHSLLLVHKRSPEQLVRLWANMKNTQERCQDVPLRAAEKMTQS